MVKHLIELLSSNHQTVSTCESLTAGLCASTIASVSGASQVLKGGFVTYFTEMKKDLVHVSEDTIQTYGVVSFECAKEMAKNTRELTHSSYALSFTGNAGPLAMENKPAGLVYCALASEKGVDVYEFQFNGLDRNTLRQRVVNTMIEKLIERLEME